MGFKKNNLKKIRKACFDGILFFLKAFSIILSSLVKGSPQDSAKAKVPIKKVPLKNVPAFDNRHLLRKDVIYMIHYGTKRTFSE